MYYIIRLPISTQTKRIAGVGRYMFVEASSMTVAAKRTRTMLPPHTSFAVLDKVQNAPQSFESLTLETRQLVSTSFYSLASRHDTNAYVHPEHEDFYPIYHGYKKQDFVPHMWGLNLGKSRTPFALDQNGYGKEPAYEPQTYMFPSRVENILAGQTSLNCLKIQGKHGIDDNTYVYSLSKDILHHIGEEAYGLNRQEAWTCVDEFLMSLTM